MNVRVYDAVKNFVIVALEYLRQQSQTHPIVFYKKSQDIFVESPSPYPSVKSGHFESKIINVPNYSELVYRYRSVLSKMPEAKKAGQILFEEGFIKIPSIIDDKGNTIQNPTFEQVESDKSNIFIKVSDIVVNYLVRYKTFVFIEKKFNELYSLFESCWLQRSVKMEAIVPLIGFYSDIDTIELSDDITIERFTPDEKNAFEESYSLISTFPNKRDYERSTYKIRLKYMTSDEPYNLRGRLSNFVYDKIEFCITALRLLHRGRLGAFNMVIKTIDYNPLYPEYIIYPLEFRLPERDIVLNLSDEYHLVDEDVSNLKQLFNKFNNSKRLKILTGALRRFNQVYSRSFYEDKVVDLTIVLENTLLFNIKKELKFRLALYGAELLGKRRDPQITYDALEALYNIRSEIVHNNKGIYDLIMDVNSYIGETVRKVTEKPEAEYYPLIEQLVREILLEYIERLSSGLEIGKINMGITKNLIDSCDQRDSIVITYLGVNHKVYI